MITPSDTIVRDFQAPDMESIQQLISASIDNTYLRHYPLQTINFFKALYSGERLLERAKKGKAIILERNGHIVGAGFILGNEIRGVFINPAFQHKGYGKKLMHELERIAAAGNHREVSLSLALPSREFLEALGYQILKERSIEVKNGKRLHYWSATKALGG